MSNSPLSTYTKVSPNKNSPRNHAIDTITIHCTAGNKNNTAKQIADFFANPKRQASCNYVVGGDGSIAISVEEKDRSWCTSSGVNDHRAITIEVCSNIPGTEVTDKAYAALIELVADICKRNGIKKLVWSTDKNQRVNHLNGCNMTVHRDYANKSCPGPWLYERHGAIAEAVNKKLGAVTVEPEKPATSGTLYRTTESGTAASVSKPAALAIGDKIKLASNAPSYGTNKTFASWVYSSTLYLREISGDRAVISTQKTGAITGAVDKKYLTKI